MARRGTGVGEPDEQKAVRFSPVWPATSGGQQLRLPDSAAGGDVLRPEVGDALEPITGNRSDVADLDVLALRFPGTPPDVMTPSWLRFQARQLIREFLSAVPRSEPDATLTFLRPNSSTRVLTRAQLSVAIDLLRPRQRQSVRLAIEERWPHKQVCAYLNHVSLRTLERDLAEALDALAQM